MDYLYQTSNASHAEHAFRDNVFQTFENYKSETIANYKNVSFYLAWLIGEEVMTQLGLELRYQHPYVNSEFL